MTASASVRASVGELAAFSSALLLALVAVLIGYEAVRRLFEPVAIDFTEAISLAAVALLVNLASAWQLFGGDHRHHGHGRAHGHEHGYAHAHDAHHNEHGDDHHHDHHYHGHNRDTNLRAAYVHVLADAMTSVLAIVALLSARFLGFLWMNPAMALIGVSVILSWSYGLVRSAGAALLDMVPDCSLVGTVRQRLEAGDDRVSDLHRWRLGPGHLGVIAAVVSSFPQEPSVYKERLADIAGLSQLPWRCRPARISRSVPPEWARAAADKRELTRIGRTVHEHR